MLPIILVILAAQCVYGAPTASLTVFNYNEIAPIPDNGRLVNSGITSGVFDLIDGGQYNTNMLTSQQVINDLANQADAYSQAVALSETISLMGTLATGIPGDSCSAANLVNAYASGNTGAIRQALNSYVATVNNYIDSIVTLATNPGALKYSNGPSGNCAGGGRNFQFEAAWDKVLDAANPYQIGLLNEQYCAARRLYGANYLVSNNMGASLSAATVQPVVRLYMQSLGPVANFLRSAANGGNVAAAAASAKAAIQNAASTY